MLHMEIINLLAPMVIVATTVCPKLAAVPREGSVQIFVTFEVSPSNSSSNAHASHGLESKIK
jgi:hypothetical protein